MLIVEIPFNSRGDSVEISTEFVRLRLFFSWGINRDYEDVVENYKNSKKLNTLTFKGKNGCNMIIHQDKVVLFEYLNKIEKAYHKTIKNAFFFGIDLDLPEKQNMFNRLKTTINDTTFTVSRDLLEHVKRVADQINLRVKYPKNYISELIIILSDLFLVIVYGYYSMDGASYSQKLIEFFDLVLALNDVFTPYIKYDMHNHRHSYLIENKTQWFSASRGMFRELFKLGSYDNYQTFESDPYYRDLRFTIKIVKSQLQIVYKIKFKPSNEFEDHYESYKIIDEFNRNNYKFILNFEKIFKENVEQKEWHNHFISNFYFGSESIQEMII